MHDTPFHEGVILPQGGLLDADRGQLRAAVDWRVAGPHLANQVLPNGFQLVCARSQCLCHRSLDVRGGELAVQQQHPDELPVTTAASRMAVRNWW